ncbi:MAG: DUF1559 domain-containing protein [Fimbriimonadales bacterium]|nr:DUF1559 domain-containing protein [Fimbriimonadales bacterium]
MKRGFTLVELLTVIAIIAILAAIIFPVAGTVRENARKSRCSSNLNQIYVALQAYKDDYRAYPPVLGAYARDINGNLITGNCAVDLNRVMSFALAPKPLGSYLRNDEIFRCPNNPFDDKRAIVPAVYPQGHALAGNRVVARVGADEVPVCFYRYDSYSIGRIGRTNNYELHYALFWSNANLNAEENRRNQGATQYQQGYYDAPVGPKATDNPRQLGYRNPDTTAVVTWCSYHRDYSGNVPTRAKNDIVLFLTGNVKYVDSYEMSQFPYSMRP